MFNFCFIVSLKTNLSLWSILRIGLKGNDSQPNLNSGCNSRKGRWHWFGFYLQALCPWPNTTRQVASGAWNEPCLMQCSVNANENLACVLKIRFTAVHMVHAYISPYFGNHPESSRGWYGTKQTEGEYKSKQTSSSCAVSFNASVTVFDTAGRTCAALTLLLTHFRKQHCVELAFLKHQHSRSYVSSSLQNKRFLFFSA